MKVGVEAGSDARVKGAFRRVSEQDIVGIHKQALKRHTDKSG